MSSVDSLFHLNCMCGCGNGIEVQCDKNAIFITWYRSDWSKNQHSLKSVLNDRLNYLKGNRLLREIVISRNDLLKFRSVLLSVSYDDYENDVNSSHAVSEIRIVHLLEEMYAIWLEGRMSEIDVIRGNFHKMFYLKITELERDAIVAAIDKWLKREHWHSIADGESPHVTRLTKGVVDLDSVETTTSRIESLSEDDFAIDEEEKYIDDVEDPSLEDVLSLLDESDDDSIVL